MKKSNLNIGILYLALHNLLIKKHGGDNVITRKTFFCHIGKHSLVPKPLRCIVLKEMSRMNLIEKVGRDNIKILPQKENLENITNFYSKEGII